MDQTLYTLWFVTGAIRFGRAKTMKERMRFAARTPTPTRVPEYDARHGRAHRNADNTTTRAHTAKTYLYIYTALVTSKRTNIKRPTRILKRRATNRRLSRTQTISRRAFHEHCIAHQCRSRVTDARLHRVRASATCSRITSASRARNRARKHRIRPTRASAQPPRIASSSFVVKPRLLNRVYTRIGPFTTKLSSSPPSRTHTARARRRYTHRNTRATRNRDAQSRRDDGHNEKVKPVHVVPRQ